MATFKEMDSGNLKGPGGKEVKKQQQSPHRDFNYQPPKRGGHLHVIGGRVIVGVLLQNS